MSANDPNFETEYNKTIKLLTMLIKLKSPLRNNQSIHLINNFEYRIEKFLQNMLLDRTDPDIIDILNKIQYMQTHVAQLKSQLIF